MSLLGHKVKDKFLCRLTTFPDMQIFKATGKMLFKNAFGMMRN
jgi:hypothetical protein